MEYSQYPEAANDSVMPDGTVDFDALDNLDNLGVDNVPYEPPPPAADEDVSELPGPDGEEYDDGELRQLNRRSGKGVYVIMGIIAALAIAALVVGSTLLAQNNRNRSIEAAQQQSVDPPTPATNTYAPTFRGTNLARTYAPSFRGTNLGKTYAPTVAGTGGNIVSSGGESSPASDPSDSSSAGTTTDGTTAGTGSDNSGTDGSGTDGTGIPPTDGSTDPPSFSFVGSSGEGEGEGEGGDSTPSTSGTEDEATGEPVDGSDGETGGSSGGDVGATDGSNGGSDGVGANDGATGGSSGSSTSEGGASDTTSGNTDGSSVGTTDATGGDTSDGEADEATTGDSSNAGDGSGALPGDLLGGDIIDGSPTSSPAAGGDADTGDTSDESDGDTEDAGGGSSGGANVDDGGSDAITDGPSSSAGSEESGGSGGESDGVPPIVLTREGHLGADGCLKEGETQVDICLPDMPLMPRAVSCCSGSMTARGSKADDSLTCFRGPTCYYAASYSDAVARCESNDMRLCTVAELESGVCCNQGCNFDFRVQWTSDVCGANIGPSPTSRPVQTNWPTADTMSNVTAAPVVTSPTSEPVQTDSPTVDTMSNATAAPVVTSPTSEPAQTVTAAPVVTSPTSEPAQTDSPTADTMSNATAAPVVTSPTSEPAQTDSPTGVGGTGTSAPSTPGTSDESIGAAGEDEVSPSSIPTEVPCPDEMPPIVVTEAGHLGADGCLKEGETQVDICLPDIPLMPRAVSCCSGSMADDSLTCSRGPTCYNAASYSDAVARCESNDMRLCTVAELESGVCCNQGCNFDFRVQWTSDVCGANIGPSPTSEPAQTNSPTADTMSNVTAAPVATWWSTSSGAPTTGLSNVTAPPLSGNASSAPTVETSQATPTLLPTRNPKVTTGTPTMSTARDPSAKPTPMPMDSLVPPPTPPPSPTDVPTMTPSAKPSASPTLSPTISVAPSSKPTPSPSAAPTVSSKPTLSPSAAPTVSIHPSSHPTASPSVSPTLSPSIEPSASPSQVPTVSSQPSASPTASPTMSPTAVPSLHPASSPSTFPSIEPTCSVSIEVDFVTEGNGNLDETGYTLLSVAGSKSTIHLEVLPGDLKDSTSHNDIACVSKGAYIFTVTDDSRKCCGDNKGYYAVKVNGEEVVRGGPYFTSPNAYIIRTDYQPPTAQKKVQWLNKHNDVRESFHTENGVSFTQLVWSESLTQAAADRANEIAPTCGPGPTIKDPWGENVARTTFGGYNETFVTPDHVFGGWDDPEDHPLAFRQIMWRPTRYVGCASNITRMYEGGPYCYVAVCKYARPGNCNVNNETWLDQTLADYSKCGPPCPDEGCF